MFFFKEFGDLVPFHLINMLGKGSYQNRSAIIVTHVGNSLYNEVVTRYGKGGSFDWPTICKIIEQTVNLKISGDFCDK